MSKKNKPEFDYYRLLQIRKKSKQGQYCTPDENAFCTLMRKHYPQEYEAMDKDVFEQTKPFGSK